MKLTWYGTATVGLDDGETRLLFDPFVRMNRRLETTPVEGFAGFDAVLVTHGHLDHIYSIPDLMRVDRTVPVYCTETPTRSPSARSKSGSGSSATSCSTPSISSPSCRNAR